MIHAEQPHYHVHRPETQPPYEYIFECYITSSRAQIAGYLAQRGLDAALCVIEALPLLACAKGSRHLALTPDACPLHPPATDADLEAFCDTTPRQMIAAGLTASEIARVCDRAVAVLGFPWYPPELAARLAPSHVETREA